MKKLLFAAAIVLLGAGCMTTPPVAPAPTPTAQKPVIQFTYNCGSYKMLSPERQVAINAILKNGGQKDLAASGDVCAQSSEDRPVLVTTDNCTQTGCTKASLLLVDTAANTLKVVATEDTSEILGAAAIGQVLSWTDTSVTYRAPGYVFDGPCIEANIKGQLAYHDVQVTLATGKKSDVQSCTYLSCKQDLTCTNKP